MRIVHLTPLYHPSVGGFQTKIKALSERLAARGHDVHVFTTAAADPESFTRPRQRRNVHGPSEPLNGVRVERSNYFSLPAPVQYPFDAVMKFWWDRRLWRNDALRNIWLGPHMIGLRPALTRLRPDLILAGPLPFLTPYAALRAARTLRIPCAVIPCLHPLQEWEFENRAHYRLLSEVDAVLPSTEYEADWARSMGARMKKICILGDGVDAPTLTGGDGPAFRKAHGIDEADLVVVFLGRTERDKGAFHLLDAAQKVWRENAAVTFLFAGRPGDGWAEALARHKGNKRIVNLGPFEEATKKEILAAADVVALPSRAESTGIVFLEAWACNKPIIGCRTGAVCEVVDDGRDGLLVRFGDAEELAAAILTLAADPARRVEMGRAGRKKVEEEHDWNLLTGRLEDLYRELLAGA